MRSIHWEELSTENQGFTLVELAIVMTIIGLLIGGVLKGQEMIQNARVTATIAQVQGYTAALHTFRDRLDNWPGDFPRATTRLPGCTAANYCVDGDGNGRVGALLTSGEFDVSTAQENAQFFKHLALADLISGVNPSANPATPAWGQTFPAGRFSGGFQPLHLSQISTYFTLSGFYLRMSGNMQAGQATAASGTVNEEQASISPPYAAVIDRKMDDGMPGTGSVQSYDIYYGADNGACEAYGGNNAYDETDKKRVCNMLFRLN